ncbi:hypothetical protein HED55_09990 [Ochrobactrum haematophilum]|uniref:Uncharacterized protein n=1 Tax=Brucella haematophila TaxID=419474 RepID=A0ABX1DKP1_9HYPH|nr:hypothetical protein [Brucella haematophila]
MYGWDLCGRNDAVSTFHPDIVRSVRQLGDFHIPIEAFPDAYHGSTAYHPEPPDYQKQQFLKSGKNLGLTPHIGEIPYCKCIAATYPIGNSVAYTMAATIFTDAGTNPLATVTSSEGTTSVFFSFQGLNEYPPIIAPNVLPEAFFFPLAVFQAKALIAF